MEYIRQRRKLFSVCLYLAIAIKLIESGLFVLRKRSEIFMILLAAYLFFFYYRKNGNRILDDSVPHVGLNRNVFFHNC